MHDADRELDARLSAQARPTPFIDAGSVAALMERAEARARQRRIRIAAITLSAVLACGGVAVPAAAIAINAFQAQTGVFNLEVDGSAPEAAVETIDPGTEGSPGAEWIDMGATDVEQYMLSVAPRELPLPADTGWDEVIHEWFGGDFQAEYVESNSLGGGDGVMAESLVVAQLLENAGRRVWLADWFDAYEAGDAERMMRAGEVLEESVDWPAEKQGSQGAYAEETRAWMRLIGQGDYDAAQEFARFSGWTEIWDGVDRGDLSTQILRGQFDALWTSDSR